MGSADEYKSHNSRKKPIPSRVAGGPFHLFGLIWTRRALTAKRKLGAQNKRWAY